MKFTGRLKEPIVDYLTGRLTLLFEPCEDFRQAYEELKDKKLLSLEIKPYRKKRSLNANSYFHLLVGKLADKQKTSKPYMKNLMLQRYGQLEIEGEGVVSLIIRDDIDIMEREELHVRPTSKTRTMDDGKLYRIYLLLRGSHTYDTAEMAALIDGVVQECKECGIQTATPDEIAEMKQKWRIDIE